MCSVAAIYRSDLCGPLKPISRLIVDLCVPDNAERFTIDFHKDENNILCHFDPRFCYGTCQALTVCNVKQNGEWETEDRFEDQAYPFPFTPGGSYTITFDFGENEIVIMVNDRPYIRFKCRVPFTMQEITYVEVLRAQVCKVTAIKLL